jgi:outer membrane lipoprotein-sorting protein
MTRHFVVGLSLAVVAAGCDPAGRAAEQVVEKNTAARGGLEAWRAVRSMSMTGNLEAGVARDPVKLANAYLRKVSQTKAEARRAAVRRAQTAPEPQVQLPFVMELKRPRLTRLEVRFRGDTAVQVFDGKEGWKLRPFLGRREVEPYSAEELRLASQEAGLDGPLIDHAAKGNKVELVGTEKVEGRDAYKLKVTSEQGQARTLWVDAETFLEVKIDGTRRLDGKPHAVSTYFRDYRLVDGLMIPHTLETTVEGVAGSEKIVVEHVSLNTEVADARFTKPN